MSGRRVDGGRFRLRAAVQSFSLLWLVVGCNKIPPTEIIVVLEADEVLRTEITRVHARVTGAAAGSKTREVRYDHDSKPEEGQALTWPLPFLVSPLRRDATRTFEFVAVAYAGTDEVGRVRALSGFVAEDTRYLTLRFSSPCRGERCDETTTCEAGKCVSAERDPEQLPGAAPESMEPAMEGGRSDTPNGDGESDSTSGGDDGTRSDDESVGPGCGGIWDRSLFGQACWGE